MMLCKRVSGRDRDGIETLVLVAAVSMAVIAAPAAFAGSVGVPGDYGTIQEAIDAAVPGDTVIVEPETYDELINFNGKAITVRSSGGADVTTINGNGVGHVSRCTSGEGRDSILQGFTLIGGDSFTGGGMFNDGSSPTVIDCVFRGNIANFGGGIFNRNASNPSISGCVFEDNVANVGAGIYNVDSNPIITDCLFDGNAASSDGGAIWNSTSQATIDRCVFLENTAVDDGGGIWNSFSNSTITNCRFLGNSVGDVGGAFWTQNSSSTLTNCAFTGNTATSGAAANTETSNPAITNCTFTRNTATMNGGAISNSDGVPVVTNCILWDNAPLEIKEEFGKISIVSHCIVQGGWAGGTDIIIANPLLADPTGTDGMDGTDDDDVRLTFGSPAINVGDNSALPAGVTVDLDGNERINDAVVDLGAYEYSCNSDVNGDGAVAFDDLLQLLVVWGPCPGCPEDSNSDDVVDFQDLINLLASWGPCP